ncbi:MAG: metallophosphoesterase [Flavobacteriaceae bacterium]|jgi:hypothetical protein|nr:metallophosphoesterase [Flavobacteriaceae bacterium]
MTTIPSTFTAFDILGDIHGHANDLKELLHALGYQKINNVYQHPTRKVLFVGDYIDRGKNVIEVLEIVKTMVDHGQAIALMGNHEYNAICYNTKDKNGNYYRAHNQVHNGQHQITLEAFKDNMDLYYSYIKWFETLPLFYETPFVRVVHACWDNEHITYLKQRLTNNCISIPLLEEANIDGTPLNLAIEDTLKGKESELPQGMNFSDKDGNIRTSIRIKWWIEPSKATYKSISVLNIPGLPDTQIEEEYLPKYYQEQQVPVFFGHYWLPYKATNPPEILSQNVCCLDYSVAKQGKLVCYRFNGEQLLTSKHLFYI